VRRTLLTEKRGFRAPRLGQGKSITHRLQKSLWGYQGSDHVTVQGGKKNFTTRKGRNQPPYGGGKKKDQYQSCKHPGEARMGVVRSPQTIGGDRR